MSVEDTLDLADALDRSLVEFAKQHEGLVRRACDVPDGKAEILGVVICALLGHCLSRLLVQRGRAATETLALNVLDQLESVRDAVMARSGTASVQEPS